MEIKTTKQIGKIYYDENDYPELENATINGYSYETKKWVALDDIFDEVSKCQKERASEADILWNLLVKLRNGGR